MYVNINTVMWNYCRACLTVESNIIELRARTEADLGLENAGPRISRVVCPEQTTEIFVE